MRKLFFLFLALVATASLWAQRFQVGDLYYIITSNSAPYTVEVTDAVSSITTAIIPENVTYDGTTYSVTSIGYWAFGECSALTSVTIPNSVTSIGHSAFRDCSSLTSITIPNSVTSIGYSAFDGCSSLTSVTIGNSVTSIGDYAFEYCSSLTKTNYTGDIAGWCNIKFGDGYANPIYYSHNFYINDQEIKDLVIPNSITSIGENAFSGCSSLTSVTIPNSVTSIGRYAFCDCSSLTSVTIPNSVTSIGDQAFYDCSSLTSITIPNSVTSIGIWAFRYCSSLTTPVYNAHCFAYMPTSFKGAYVIPEGIKQIAGGAFYFCRSLTSITFPNSVTSIGSYAFERCSSLTSVTIPNSVTSIGESAFSGCSSLTTPVYNAHCFAYMPTSFKGAYVIPEGIKQIAGGAFRGCSSLTSVTIGNSVESIGSSAFAWCESLTSVTIGNSVTSIGYWAFGECSALTSVTINSNAIVSKDYSYNSNISHIFGSQVTEYIIGDDAKGIGSYAFYNCSSLTSITIPNSVTSIGDNAFRACSSLTSITIPNSVTSIGYRAFCNCTSLTSITIPNSVTSIGNEAFYGCSSLTSVTINSNAIVSKDYYSYSSNISDIFGSQVTEYIIGDDVKGIGDYAFEGCSSLTSITCEATTPPTVGEYAFDDVSKSIPVYVPCGCVEAYKAASGWSDFTNIQEPLVKYSIEVNVNNTIMGSAKVDYNTFCEGNQISATPNLGYHLVQWSDGNTDNPRTLELTQDTILIAEFAQSFSGQCGDSLYWEYDSTNKTISITGSGDMYNYTADTQPWLLFKEEIAEVTISNTATSIGTSAFEGCIRLGKVSIGTATKNIAANAFAACTKLYDIYCLAAEPPTGYTSSFANYNAFLHVPCESQRLYMLDILFGEFKYIECIASDEVPTDDIVITPGSTDVTITWPTKEGADTYTIVIKKDGEVVCTLTFNSEGQLLNIAFAPGRNGNHPAQYAEQAGNGYRFTVTGLEEGTDYTYDITVKDASNKTINSHSGKFTTESLTAVDNITTNNANIQKILRNGQLTILRNGVEYNAMGQEL